MAPPLIACMMSIERGAERCCVPICTTRRCLRCASTSSSPSRDRKSTRLNSSHSQISYAVFCLKKKNTFPVNGFLNFGAILTESVIPKVPTSVQHLHSDTASPAFVQVCIYPTFLMYDALQSSA